MSDAPPTAIRLRGLVKACGHRRALAGIDLTITPYLADQELPLATVYWEGAVRFEGTAGGQPASGSGYVELTGYAEQQGQENVRVR